MEHLFLVVQLVCVSSGQLNSSKNVPQRSSQLRGGRDLINLVSCSYFRKLLYFRSVRSFRARRTISCPLRTYCRYTALRHPILNIWLFHLPFSILGFNKLPFRTERFDFCGNCYTAVSEAWEEGLSRITHHQCRVLSRGGKRAAPRQCASHLRSSLGFLEMLHRVPEA